MRSNRAALILIGAGFSIFFLGFAGGQTPAAAKKGAAPARAAGGSLNGTTAQLMKGIFYPNANVIFAAQSDNPDDVKPAKDPSTATDPLQSAYGKWQAVENAGLAMADAASLISLPGRKCSSGVTAPVTNPVWVKAVADVRAAGLAAYKAAQAKDQDKILDVAEQMTTACANCHDKYREKEDLAQRCK
jgi:hypothetical protein